MKKDKKINISLNLSKLENEQKEEKIDDSIELLNKHNEKVKEERMPRIGKTYKEAKLENIQDDSRKELSIKKLVISVLIILGIILGYLFFEYAPILGIRLPRYLDSEINIDVVSTENDIYTVYNDELLMYSNHVISTYNKKGKKTWEHQLEASFNPNIYVHEKYMAISNNSNGIIYLFQGKNELLNMKVDGQIECIYMDSNGNLAVEYSTNSYKKIIGVYNKKGENIYNTYLEYTTIVDIKLLDNGNKLLITQANANSFKIGCTISILDGKSQDKGITEVLKLDNNFIYDIEQINNELILLLDNKIMIYNIDTNEQRELKEFDSSQVLFVSLLNKYYVTIEKSLDNNTYNIIANDYNNIEISNTVIENSPKSVINSKYLNYCIYHNKIDVINKWGIEVLSKDVSIMPKDIVIFNDNKSAALVYTNKIEIINL